MASSAESGIDVDSKKGSMSGSKTDKKEKSSDDLFGSKISVSHIIISGLGADETSVVQGHLGFLNPGNDDTDNRNRPASHLILAIIVSIIIPVFGVPAVLMAVKAKRSLKDEKIDAARKYSNYSLVLSLIGMFFIGVVIVIAYLLALSKYDRDRSDATVGSTQEPSLEALNSRLQHRLPYQRYRGSIYDINYDVFNRYL